MIYLEQIHKYCREDPALIENYDLAVSSKERWHCHHRLELTLNGEEALTIRDLKRFGMYYHRPAFELIFLRIDAHTKLHHSARGSVWFGRSVNKHTMETREKIGNAHKNKVLTAETRSKISKSHIGKKPPPITDETRRKRAESVKAWWDAHPEAKKERGAIISQNFKNNPETVLRMKQNMRKAWIKRKEKQNGKVSSNG